MRPQTAANNLRQAAEAGLHFLRMLDAANLSRLRPTYLKQYALATPSDTDADSQSMLSIRGRKEVVDASIQLRADLTHSVWQATCRTGAECIRRRAGGFSSCKAGLHGLTPCSASPPLRTPGLPSRAGVQLRPRRRWRCHRPGRKGVGRRRFCRLVHLRPLTPHWRSCPGRQPPRQLRHATFPSLLSPFAACLRGAFGRWKTLRSTSSALSASAEDLGRMLLREIRPHFYGNDWFQIPLAVPVGCQVSVVSLSAIPTPSVSTRAIPHYASTDSPTLSTAAAASTAAAWRMFARRKRRHDNPNRRGRKPARYSSQWRGYSG